jgi:SAM-dependent methyltransferase
MSVEYDASFYRSIGDEGVATARAVVPLVVELLGPLDSVLDLGCGVGSWLSVFEEQGTSRVHGVDGDYVPRDQLRFAPDDFEAADLSSGYETDERYDLAVSLEVAEHLPERSAARFVRSLVACAPAVLFSAAIPGQGGRGHVNEQWPEYWAALFRNEGFDVLDPVRPAIWDRRDVSWCIAQNTLLYVREDVVAASASLLDERERTRNSQLALVHPRHYELLAIAANLSIRRLVGSMPAAAIGSARRRLGKGGRPTRH